MVWLRGVFSCRGDVAPAVSQFSLGLWRGGGVVEGSCSRRFGLRIEITFTLRSCQALSVRQEEGRLVSAWSSVVRCLRSRGSFGSGWCSQLSSVSRWVLLSLAGVCTDGSLFTMVVSHVL
ncbi:unnamed protein product [Brassica oleracea]